LNPVKNDQLDVPKLEVVEYETLKEEKKIKISDSNDDSAIIFCIDISRSMGSRNSHFYDYASTRFTCI